MLRYIPGLVVAAALLMAPVRPAAADALFTAPQPDWVQPLEVPAPDPALLAAVDNGLLMLLSDEQVQWDGEERLIFSRSVRQIVRERGVAAASRVELRFAPDQETLLLTRIAITRAGQVQEVTNQVFSTTVDGGTGQTTAEVIIPGLRTGDVVEVAYLRRQLPAQPGANQAGRVQVEPDAPTVLARAIVNWPESWPIYIAGWPARIAFTQETAPGIIRHVWTRAGHVPAPAAPQVPPGYSDNTTIAFSAFPDWTAVTGALSPHYTGSYPLGPEWDAKLRAIQAAHSFAGDRAIAALRAVQDDLPYQPRALAADRWLGRLPADVTASGAGDAKDKALLLRAMLDKMGIEAYVALTHQTQSHGLPDQLVSFGAFDHAIVKAVVDGLPVWMDPSAQHEGGDFYNAAVPDFGHALPLSGADQQQLEMIDQSYTSAAATYIDETHDFTLLGVYQTIVTARYGHAANAYRREHMATDTPPDAALFAAQLARYPALRQLGAVVVEDDRANNLVTVTERYLLPATALTGAAGEGLILQSLNPLAFLPAAGADPRTAPLDLGQPASLTHRINLYNAPSDLTAPLGASAYNDAIGYAFSGYVPETRALSLEWTFTQYLRDVAPDMADQVLRDAQVMADNSSYTVRLRP